MEPREEYKGDSNSRTRVGLPVEVRERSGRARDSSISMIRPKPRQAGQAPSGWLKEKRAGVGAWKSR